MFRALVRTGQFFGNEYTIGQAYEHFAERADLETQSADMLFYNDFRPDGVSVITKEMVDGLKKNGVSANEKAIDYMRGDYPFVSLSKVDEFTRNTCKIDTPVIDENGVPQYVILKGYKKKKNADHYICSVLSGLSDYHLSVNADMTVSCGCMLRMGGYLGNLKEQTLKEIYDSDYLASLRKSISDGIVPTVSCVKRCRMLRKVPESMALYYMSNYKVPKGIMFENTSICNLQCDGCYNAYIKRDTISIDDTKKFAMEVKNNDIRIIHLFKYGETFTDRDLGEKIRIIKEYNPEVELHVSTNGLMLDKYNNLENALEFDWLMFSLDGMDNETVCTFQKNGNFDRVYKNMCDLIKLRDSHGKQIPYVTWRYVLFPHNDSIEQVKKAFELAKKAGVDRLQFRRAFNSEIASSTLDQSEVFVEYMKEYKFNYDGARLNFELRN